MNTNINGILTSLRALLVVIGSILADHGLENSTAYSVINTIAGSILIVGPVVWELYSQIQAYRKAQAVGVQAGIDMTAQGKAVDTNGNTVSQFSVKSETPPKPVTLETAQQIVTNFGVDPATIKKS